MEKEGLVIITTKKDFKEWINEAIDSKLKNKALPEFENDRISKSKAAKLADMSAPTFNKRVSEGIFRQHGNGRKIFFLKSELIHALRSSNL